MAKRRRPVDVGRCAVAIADAEGWVVLGRKESRDAVGGVSLIVAGGELRGQAVLTVVTVVGMTWEGPTSSHLPRSLPPPRDRRASRGEVVVRLREHPSAGTLDDVLAADHGMTAGEAVTVLAAVALGLADLHGAGRGGVGLAPADIGFRDDGCPVLTAIDRLRELDQQTMAEDVAGFAELAGTVCGAVIEGGGAAVLAAATAQGHRSWGDVVAGVLRAADPTAVQAVGSVVPVVSAPGARDDPPPVGARSADRRERGGRRGGGEILWVIERTLDLLGERPVARGLAVAWDWIVVRPKVVAVACSPLVAVTVLLMVVPGQDGPR